MIVANCTITLALFLGSPQRSLKTRLPATTRQVTCLLPLLVPALRRGVPSAGEWRGQWDVCDLWESSHKASRDGRSWESGQETEVRDNLFIGCSYFEHQWLLSWLLHKWREGYLLPTLARRITCRHFHWMLQLSSERKWRSVSSVVHGYK